MLDKGMEGSRSLGTSKKKQNSMSSNNKTDYLEIENRNSSDASYFEDESFCSFFNEVLFDRLSFVRSMGAESILPCICFNSLHCQSFSFDDSEMGDELYSSQEYCSNSFETSMSVDSANRVGTEVSYQSGEDILTNISDIATPPSLQRCVRGEVDNHSINMSKGYLHHVNNDLNRDDRPSAFTSIGNQLMYHTDRRKGSLPLVYRNSSRRNNSTVYNNGEDISTYSSSGRKSSSIHSQKGDAVMPRSREIYVSETTLFKSQEQIDDIKENNMVHKQEYKKTIVTINGERREIKAPSVHWNDKVNRLNDHSENDSSTRNIMNSTSSKESIESIYKSRNTTTKLKELPNIRDIHSFDNVRHTTHEYKSFLPENEKKNKHIRKVHERNYDLDPALLYRAIDTKQWGLALRYLKSNPREAREWVFRRMPNGLLAWRFLPIHAACFTGAPSELLSDLIRVCPAAVRESIAGGKLPIHIACEIGAHRKVVLSLLEHYPDSICALDAQGNSPLQICQTGTSKNKSQIMKILTKPTSSMIPKITKRWKRKSLQS